MKYQMEERKCDWCGKIFIPAPCHIYVSYQKIFCGYNCRFAYTKQRDEQREARKRMKKEQKRKTTEDK